MWGTFNLVSFIVFNIVTVLSCYVVLLFPLFQKIIKTKAAIFEKLN